MAIPMPAQSLVRAFDRFYYLGSRRDDVFREYSDDLNCFWWQYSGECKIYHFFSQHPP